MTKFTMKFFVAPLLALMLTLTACSQAPDDSYNDDSYSYTCVEPDGDECDDESSHKVKKDKVKKYKTSKSKKSKKSKSSGFSLGKTAGKSSSRRR